MMTSERLSRLLISTLLLLAVVLLGSRPGLSAAPPLYDGELNVCNNLAREMSAGMTPRGAVARLMGLYGANDPETLRSIQRTVIHTAIRVCGQSATDVIAGAYQAGLPLDLIVGAAAGAGVSENDIRRVLLAAGATSTEISAAYRSATAPEISEDVVLSAPFRLIGGLGRSAASPFSF